VPHCDLLTIAPPFEDKAGQRMKALSTEQLKELLNTDHIRGTPEQIRMLGIRIGELEALNGRNWITQNASNLLAQWDMVLSRYGRDKQDE
jgi:hypothetical protein